MVWVFTRFLSGIFISQLDSSRKLSTMSSGELELHLTRLCHQFQRSQNFSFTLLLPALEIHPPPTLSFDRNGAIIRESLTVTVANAELTLPIRLSATWIDWLRVEPSFVLNSFHHINPKTLGALPRRIKCFKKY